MKPLYLLFVYNADADVFSALTDFVHKIISPATYNCSLCKLTYGNTKMKQQWKEFLQSLPGNKTFLHKDEFEKKYATTSLLPAIFYIKENQPMELLLASEINSYQTLDQLQAALLSKIEILQNTPE